jgi:hypothetical protein
VGRCARTSCCRCPASLVCHRLLAENGRQVSTRHDRADQLSVTESALQKAPCDVTSAKRSAEQNPHGRAPLRPRCLLRGPRSRMFAPTLSAGSSFDSHSVRLPQFGWASGLGEGVAWMHPCGCVCGAPGCHMALPRCGTPPDCRDDEREVAQRFDEAQRVSHIDHAGWPVECPPASLIDPPLPELSSNVSAHIAAVNTIGPPVPRPGRGLV